jgi:hypothetical protein
MAIKDDLAQALFPTLQGIIDFFSQKLGKDALELHDFEATGALLRALTRRHGNQALQSIEAYFGERGEADLRDHQRSAQLPQRGAEGEIS